MDSILKLQGLKVNLKVNFIEYDIITAIINICKTNIEMESIFKIYFKMCMVLDTHSINNNIYGNK